jgi:hypothetical protein
MMVKGPFRLATRSQGYCSGSYTKFAVLTGIGIPAWRDTIGSSVRKKQQKIIIYVMYRFRRNQSVCGFKYR